MDAVVSGSVLGELATAGARQAVSQESNNEFDWILRDSRICFEALEEAFSALLKVAWTVMRKTSKHMYYLYHCGRSRA